MYAVSLLLMDCIFVTYAPGIYLISTHVKLCICHIKAERHWSIGLQQLYDPNLTFRLVVQAAAGGAAGNIKRAFWIHRGRATGIGISLERLTESVDEGGAGIDMIVCAKDQIDIVGLCNTCQIFLTVRVSAFRTGIRRKMLDKNAPFRIRMFRDHLGSILLLNLASLDGIAVQHDKKDISPDKIIIAVLIVLAQPSVGAVWDIKMLVEVRSAWMPISFKRIGVWHVMVPYYGSQRDTVQ